ncbi:Uncharacterised protein [Vibrio cholerae]|uniref:Uncharacterized protein n=1 Tax=Vibrio cholerae TaxID=666 RepID=A0A655R842_VIBCL|nr:Uncharacterised protein [Vibrio cholerae]CSB32441.1 Uncharacterised protein [Vibrio cholerae]
MRLVDRTGRRIFTVAHGNRNRIGSRLQLLNHVTNFRRGLLSTLCQSTNFIGDHRKAAARFTGSRRFNRCVECEQVGLIRNVVNHFQHGFNVCSRAFQHFHIVYRSINSGRKGINGFRGFGNHIRACGGGIVSHFCSRSGTLRIIGYI